MTQNFSRNTILLTLTAPLAVLFASKLVQSYVGVSFNILSTSNHWSTGMEFIAYLVAPFTSGIAATYCLVTTQAKLRELDHLSLLLFWVNGLAFIGLIIFGLYILIALV